MLLKELKATSCPKHKDEDQGRSQMQSEFSGNKNGRIERKEQK